LARTARVALVAAAAGLGLAAEWASYGPGVADEAVGDFAVGMAWIGAGVVAGERGGRARTGPAMAAVGVTWFLGGLFPPLLYLHRGPLAQVLLGFPDAMPAALLARAVVGVSYLDGAVEPVARSAVATLVWCALLAGTAAYGYARETGVRRRARLVSSSGAVVVATVLALAAAARLAGRAADGAALWAYDVTLVVVPVALCVDLLTGRWATRALTGLVVDLGGLDAPVTLRDRLARALGDRSLELGYVANDGAGYVDEAGRALTLPPAGSDRAVTPIERDGERVAILVHDPAVLQDRALVDAVAAATRLAVVNARLQAQVRTSVAEVAASRRRIIEAADAQRRDLARELHDGAEERLAAVAGHIDALAGDAHAPEERALVADARGQLEAAVAELGELARGIRPAALTSGGLAAALPELAARAAIPVDVHVAVGRLPAAVEAAAYFVCGEALANVAKYASASRASIDVRAHGGQLLLAIADDGVGGADPARGTGLRGLADRAEALGGRLVLDSPPGGGTRLAAELPVG
jgi:signal transduction histidine kinase